jgi:hypothetical protein
MKKKFKPSIIVFLIIILVIASYIVFTLITDDDKLEENPYINTEYSWSINYPLGWKIIEVDTGDVDFIDESSDNILYIRVEPHKDFTTKILDEEIEIWSEIIKNNNYIISQRNRLVNNMNSYEFIYKNEDGQSTLKEKRILIERDGRVFNIIYIAEIDLYDEYDSLAEKSIETFNILK